MVIDSSAVVAILFQEPDARMFAAAIEAEPVPVISAASMVEVGVGCCLAKPRAHAKTLPTFSGNRVFKLKPSISIKRNLLSMPLSVMERAAGIQRNSTSATAFHTPSLKQPASHCCSRAPISRKQICRRLSSGVKKRVAIKDAGSDSCSSQGPLVLRLGAGNMPAPRPFQFIGFSKKPNPIQVRYYWRTTAPHCHKRSNRDRPNHFALRNPRKARGKAGWVSSIKP